MAYKQEETISSMLYYEESLARNTLNAMPNISSKACAHTKILLATKILDYRLDQAKEATTEYLAVRFNPDAAPATVAASHKKLTDALDKVKGEVEEGAFVYPQVYNPQVSQFGAATMNWVAWDEYVPTYAGGIGYVWGTGEDVAFYTMQASVSTFGSFVSASLDSDMWTQTESIMNKVQVDWVYGTESVSYARAGLADTLSQLAPQWDKNSLSNFALNNCPSTFRDDMNTITADLTSTTPNLSPDSYSSFYERLVDCAKAVHAHLDLINLSDLMGKCTTDTTGGYATGGLMQ